MDSLFNIFVALLVLSVGGAFGFLACDLINQRRLRAARDDAKNIIDGASAREKEMMLAAKEEALKLRTAVENENRERRADLQRLERRLTQKEESLDHKTEAIERRERTLTSREKDIETLRTETEDLKRQQRHELERVSGLPVAEAKELLLKSVETEVRADASRRARETEAQIEQEAEERARNIIAAAIQRNAASVVTDTTVTVVPLPSDELKGRIIGREGRNIRALENATGVDLIIDDTPDAISLSGFDPVRREVARIALERLILDGRIHPARIEEAVEKARQEVDAIIQAEGERAAFETGVSALHPEFIKLLGRLKYRYSYGQNVLLHSVEVARLATMMAAEMGADVEVARRAGLLHDIGKAVDHEVEGPHALIGADLARRYGQPPEVVAAIGGHHGEREASSVEAALIIAADSLSGARPGARRESLDRYVKRLEALEAIAHSFPGVDKCFAMQAGREIRVIVKPEDVDDLGSIRLARDVVKKIQDNLSYPGQIKVTVVRETRAIDYAR